MSSGSINTTDQLIAYWDSNSDTNRLNLMYADLFKSDHGYILNSFFKLLRDSSVLDVTGKTLSQTLSQYVKDNSMPLNNDLNLNNKKILNVCYDYQDGSVVTNSRLNKMFRRWFTKLYSSASEEFDLTFSTAFNQVMGKLTGTIDLKAHPDFVATYTFPTPSTYSSDTNQMYNISNVASFCHAMTEKGPILVPFTFSIDNQSVTFTVSGATIADTLNKFEKIVINTVDFEYFVQTSL